MRAIAPVVSVKPPTVSGDEKRWRLFFSVVAPVYLVLLIAPWHFSMPEGHLDWGHHAAVAHGLLSGWQWGRDVIFTFGPLGILYFRPFLEGTLLTTAVFWILVSVVLAIHFLELVKGVPLFWRWILLLGFALPFTYYRIEPVLFVIPLLAAIGVFRSPQPVVTWKILLLALIAGPTALIKLTFGILALSIFLVLDADRVYRRAFPLFTPAFLATLFAGYLYAGQDPRYFIEFFSRPAGTITGYSENMQLWLSFIQLALFLLAGIATVFIAWYCEFGRYKPVRPRVRSILFALCLSLFLFMIFKAGYVRQELHTMTSWDALSAGLAAYVASVWHRVDSRKVVLCGLGVAIFSCSYSILLQNELYELDAKNRVAGAPLQELLWNKFVGRPLQQLGSAGLFVFDREGWLLNLRRQRDAALAAVRTKTPLPDLDGSVDSIPDIQSSLLAHHLDYRPRPNLQEYTAYTDSLIDANLEFLRSARAPKYIIHGAGSIDHRYPALADGPMWPELLRLYEPLRVIDNFVLLRRRDKPPANILSKPLKLVARFGQPIALPVRRAVVVNIDFRKTFLGTIAQLLFRPGSVTLAIKLADGSLREYYRLVPGIARRGFVLSPYVSDGPALAALSAGFPELRPYLEVTSLHIDADSVAKLSYEPTFEIQFREIETEKLQTGSPDSEVYAMLRPMFEKRKYLIAAAQSSGLPLNKVNLRGKKLNAYAPAVVSIAAPGTGLLNIGFGLRDGAWRLVNQSDGACFRVSAGSTAETAGVLWKRCLRPATETRDRGEQTASIQLGADMQERIFFETDCAGSCDGDWSYWSRIEFAPRRHQVADR